MQHNEKDGVNVTFKLVDIIIPKYSFVVPPQDKPIKLDHQYTIEVNSGVFFDAEKKNVIVVLHTKYFYDKEKQILVSDLVTQTVYGIENFGEVIKQKNKDEFDVPDQLLLTLFSIALSSTRGIMMEKSSNNFLQKVFIPIVDPKELIKKRDKSEQKEDK